MENTINAAEPRRVVFVVGSALSAGPDADGGACGVWSVARIVEEIGKLDDTLRPVQPECPAADYQRLLGQLQARRKRPAVEALVRRAVLAACTAAEEDKQAVLVGSDAERRAACERLQARTEDWRLPSGICALAALLAQLLQRVGKSAESAPCVVTTNFDGLLEVALTRLGVDHVSRGSARNEYARPESTKVEILHAHGFWCDEPTMHTPEALTARRPALWNALRDRFDGADVYVLGYGAWHDIVFGSLTEVIGAVSTVPDVMWAFYPSEEEVRERLKHEGSEARRVVERFSSALGRCSVNYYAGVDAHVHWPAALGTEEAQPKPSSSNVALRERLDALIREGLRRLLEATPDPGGSRLRALLDQTTPLDLCGALAAVCRTMQELPGTARSEFNPAAKRAVFDWALAAGSELPALELGTAEVHSVPIETAAFAEIMMARAQGEQPRLFLRNQEAIGEDALFAEATYQESRIQEPEAGPEGSEWVHAFERCLWDRFRPNELFDHKKLLGELAARDDLGRRISALLEPGAVRDQWTPVAKELPSVTFIHLGSGSDAVLPADEHRLAALIREFVRLESSPARGRS